MWGMKIWINGQNIHSRRLSIFWSGCPVSVTVPAWRCANVAVLMTSSCLQLFKYSHQPPADLADVGEEVWWEWRPVDIPVYRKWKPCIKQKGFVSQYQYNVNTLNWIYWLWHPQNDLARYMSPRNTRSETMVSCKTSKCIPAGSFDTLQHLLKF